MQDKNTDNHHTVLTLVFLLGCLGLIAVTALDKLYWHTGILAEGWPDFSQGHLIRSIVICVSIIAIFWALIGRNIPRMILVNNYGIPIERLSILVTLFASATFLFLFIFKPTVFNTLSLEDGLIEWGSALLLFSGCLIFAISFSTYRNNFNIPKVTQLSLALFSLVFFVIAMEEVSWFQRVLEVGTPKAFKGNLQNEMNLHNFATDYIENIYYIGTYLFLVVLPFIYLLFSFLSNYNYLQLFIARPFIAVIGTVPCAYNFDMWNISFTQISFFSSIMILFALIKFGNNRNERHLIVFTIILIVVTQGLFLANGVKFARLWEVTEYKEFFISLLLFIYSLDVYTHISRVYLPEKSNRLHSDKKTVEPK